MSTSVSQVVAEDLAQMGIKKGSMLWPLLSLTLVALGVVIYFQPPGKSALHDLFDKTCAAANSAQPSSTPAAAPPTAPAGTQSGPEGSVGGSVGKKTSPPPASGKPAAAPTSALAAGCLTARTSAELQLLSEKFGQPDVSTVGRWTAITEIHGARPGIAKSATNPLDHANWWQLFVETAKGYTRDSIAKFGVIGLDFATSTGLAGLIALVPGLMGMIYRRNFWGWFAVSFAASFLTIIGVGGQRSEEAKWFVFVVSQLLLIVLAMRLRRYTRRTSPIPAVAHNWVLAIALWLVAIAWWFGIGGPIWTTWSGWFQWEAIIVGLPLAYSLLRRSDAWSGQAPKNIVICLDGTTNTPDQLEFGRLAQTNIFKLFKMLKADVGTPVAFVAKDFNASLTKRYKDRQIGFYYSGVGNRFEYDPIVQMLGGATGLGAAGVVDRAYLDVVRVYRPGDRIFIHGFSRGAAIARLLARAIDQKGAPDVIWTLRLFGRHWTVGRSRVKPGQATRVPVTVLGCFDTVGAFGIAKTIGGIEFQKLDLFKDLTVPDNVEQAYHMVALDERREEFEPTLMDPDPIVPARIVEVWFSGDHANVGGGWATTRLSDLTLDFLLRKTSSGYAHSDGMSPGAESWGMCLSAIRHGIAATPSPNPDAPKPFALDPDPLGHVRQWKSRLYVYKPRELPDHAVISETVFIRMANAAPLYAPESLFNLHDALDQKRQSVSTAVTRLKQTASLTENEVNAMLAFKDRLQLTRWPYGVNEPAHLPQPAIPVEEMLANQRPDGVIA